MSRLLDLRATGPLRDLNKDLFDHDLLFIYQRTVSSVKFADEKSP